MFNHRLTSLFYRCWEKYRYHVHYQKSARDDFSHHMYSLLGFNATRKNKDSALDHYRLIPLINMLTRHVRSAEVLARTLSVYFGGIRCHIEEFIPQNVTIDRSQRSQLGRVSCTLGTTAFLGSKVRDAATRFRVHIGPLSFRQYCHFLPGQKNHQALRELVRMIVVDRLDFDILLKVDVTDVPPLKIGKTNKQGLGWTTWLGEPKEKYIHVQQPGVE
jgi:type VI secretion system protein ImpH